MKTSNEFFFHLLLIFLRLKTCCFVSFMNSFRQRASEYWKEALGEKKINNSTSSRSWEKKMRRKIFIVNGKLFFLLSLPFFSHHHHIIEHRQNVHQQTLHYTKRNFHSTESFSHIISLSSAHEENALLTRHSFALFFSVCACFIVDKREENSFFCSSRGKKRKQEKDIKIFYDNDVTFKWVTTPASSS